MPRDAPPADMGEAPYRGATMREARLARSPSVMKRVNAATVSSGQPVWRTCAAAGLTLCTWSPPKMGMTTDLWVPSATCPITKSQRDAAGAADKDETEVPAPCSCASTERDEDVVFPALMLLQAWKS